MQLNQATAEKLLADMGMNDMPIMEIVPTPTALSYASPAK